MLGLGLFGSITVAVTPWFSKRIGKRNTMMVGWLVSITGQLVMWVGAKVQNVPIIIAANIIVNLGLGFISGLIAVMLADAVDYGEWKNGVRAEGIITAFSSFGAQLGMGLGPGWLRCQPNPNTVGPQRNYLELCLDSHHGVRSFRNCPALLPR